MINYNYGDRIIFKNEINYSLSVKQEISLLISYCNNYPELVEKILKIKENYNCDFPFECKYFPCENLSCKCTELDNGYPVKRS